MKYPCFHLAKGVVIRNDHFEDILDLFVKVLTIIDQIGCHKNLIKHNTQEIKKIKEREHKDSAKIAEMRKAVKTAETEMTKQRKRIPLLSKKVFDRLMHAVFPAESCDVEVISDPTGTSLSKNVSFVDDR